jgi:hypothetical protein
MVEAVERETESGGRVVHRVQLRELIYRSRNIDDSGSVEVK